MTALERLKEAAWKATPGPWTPINVGTDDEPMWSVKAARIAGRPARHEVAICATGDSPQEMETANAHFIALAHPHFILRLIAVAEAAKVTESSCGDAMDPALEALWDALAALEESKP